eukprot:c14385_g1_i1 orf=82-522(+)
MCSMDTIRDMKAGEETDDTYIQNWSTMIEEWLQGLDDNVNQCSKLITGLQSIADISVLQSLPSRVAVLEQCRVERISQRIVGRENDENGLIDDPDGIQLESKIQALPEICFDHTKRIGIIEDQIKDLKALLEEISKAKSCDFESIQ